MLALAAGEVVGQQAGTGGDTLQVRNAADSVRARRLELLRDLAREPGADSARLAADSARLAGPQPPGRPTIGPPPSPGADTVLAGLLALEGYAVTRYTGREAEYQASDGVLLLRGDSTVEATFRGSEGTE
ncbi:MAG: hypothetical protein RQ751_02900, partial [Longimicrobiales bacterium]|nr:hypothetical protein [Longimicrobiales bacterium]